MSHNAQQSARRGRRALTWALSVVALVGLGGAVQAGWGRGKHSPEEKRAHMEKRVGHVLDKLDATDTQRALVAAKVETLFAAFHEARGDRKALKAEVLAQWNSEKPDAARLHALVDERIEAMRVAAHAAVDAGLEVHGAFTPEQRASLAELAEKRMGRHGRDGRNGPPSEDDKE